MSDSNDHQPVDCPKCHTRMRQHTVAGITIDKCPGCKGLWLDAMEKEHLMKYPETAKTIDHEPTFEGPDYNADRNIKCPRDHSHMLATTDPDQRHIKYETCTVCGGVYLDAGELADLSELTLVEKLKGILG